MRNSMALCVRQNRLNLILRYFELFRDFGGAQAVIEIVDDCVDWHPPTAQHGRAALDPRVHFHQRAL
jgi:hypothetical protein